MARYARLSLETVSWTRRVVAILLALFVAMVLYAPISGLLTFLRTGDAQILAQIPLSFLAPIFLLAWLALVPSGFAIFLFWLVPALALNHVTLWLRSNVFGFIAAGAATGVLGVVFLSITNLTVNHGGDTAYDALQWGFLRGHIMRSALPAGLTGAVAAIVAWRIMSFGLGRPATTAMETSKQPLR